MWNLSGAQLPILAHLERCPRPQVFHCLHAHRCHFFSRPSPVCSLARARLYLKKRQWIMFWRSSPFWVGVVGGGENSPGSDLTLFSSVYSSLIARQNSADLKRIKIHERIRYASTLEGVRKRKKTKNKTSSITLNASVVVSVTWKYPDRIRSHSRVKTTAVI